MGYKLGSFNMFKFQAYRANEEIRKDLDRIADIIYTERFDIVAMQEIFGETPMNMILARLGKHWTGRWKAPNSKSPKAAEGYTFIWNTDRIGLAESVTATGKRVSEPDIYQNYSVDIGQDKLIRDPFYRRFKPKYENFELRLINTHIIYSSDYGNTDGDLSQIGDVQKRKNEFEILVKKILAHETLRRYGNNLPAYAILMGDYNLNMKKGCNNAPYLQEMVEVNDGRYSYNYITVQDQPTTLKNFSKENPDIPTTGYANNYDRFTYEMDRGSDLHPKASAVMAVESYYNSDFEKYKKEVSDHVPIYLDIDLKG